MCLEQEHKPKSKNINPEIKKKNKTKKKTQKHFGPILNPLLGFLLPSSLLYSLSFPKEIMAERGGGERGGFDRGFGGGRPKETGDTMEGTWPVARRRRRSGSQSRSLDVSSNPTRLSLWSRSTSIPSPNQGVPNHRRALPWPQGQGQNHARSKANLCQSAYPFQGLRCRQ